MSADLSVIVVTWNSRREIVSCLQSVLAARPSLDLELTVVDNASEDDTVTVVTRNFPEAALIANSHNRGFAVACNQAIATAAGRYLLLLNPDTRLHGDALRSMVDYLDLHPEVGALGPRLVNMAGEVQRSCTRYPSLWSTLWAQLRGGGFVPRRRDGASAVDAVSGAALMVRRALCHTVGQLDPTYFMYCEDTDWCYRIGRAGWQIHYLPTAEILHLRGASANQVAAASYVRRRISRLLFVRTHRPRWQYETLLRLTRLNIRRRQLLAGSSGRCHFTSVLELFEREMKAHE